MRWRMVNNAAVEHDGMMQMLGAGYWKIGTCGRGSCQSKAGSYRFFEEMIKVYYLLDNLPWESSDGHNYLCGYGSIPPKPYFVNS